ncbi:hypothetical protein PMNALOAF_3996 [Methylobacterium adhaesivum]|jgi:hypothetical protein|uniref:Uncharacterized protein n=1 Tax=Methylobacterium adhaesivum TaxID=333297 RepID=A0ABT8BH28_9HYPH|nr:hypothetical protein [Methylobacterium adhaesivum]MDN3591447.1 hypothetical protein [Methylobacterium adhaesivum]GJD32719.1 hypothetical protein PMNALOAF_3996 [Methylobacterium adhaesivum]
MPLRPTLVLLALLAPALAAAQGTPRSVGECERLKNDLAYNQCLAMFGPAAKNIAGGIAEGAASASASVATALAAIPPGIAAALPSTVQETGRRGRRGRYGRHGRQSASFDTGGGARSYRRHRRR